MRRRSLSADVVPTAVSPVHVRPTSRYQARVTSSSITTVVGGRGQRVFAALRGGRPRRLGLDSYACGESVRNSWWL